MSLGRMDEVWEVRGLPVLCEPGGPGGEEADVPRVMEAGEVAEEATPGPARGDATGGGDGVDRGVVGRIADCRQQRFVRLEGERRREARIIEAHIEQATVELKSRMERMLQLADEDIEQWKTRLQPHLFETYCATDFTDLMAELDAIYRVRRDIVAECVAQQMSLESERTSQLRDVFKTYHPLLTRAFYKMPAEVEEQLELEAVAINEMVLSNLRLYAEARFNRLTGEFREKHKLVQLWRVRRDSWRSLNISQAKNRLSSWLEAASVEARVEAPLVELEAEMATVWQHFREHLIGLPDLFLKMVTDESLDAWQDEAYEILNAMNVMFTTQCKSYQKLYIDLENAWYHQLELVGDDLVNREVTDAETWETLADECSDIMFGPIKQKVEERVQEAQAKWTMIFKAAPTQVDYLYNYIASSCEIFSLHLTERERYAKKLEEQLSLLETQQASKEAQLEQRINRAIISMMEESKVAKVRQLQVGLEKTMLASRSTYEQCQERRLVTLLQYSQRLQEETLLVQEQVAEKLQTSADQEPEPLPEPPPEHCHRLLTACRRLLLSPSEIAEIQALSTANIGWFLACERRKLEQNLGDFLVDKLLKMRDLFNQKIASLPERVQEIELRVHDRRCAEIQLHQQRVDSHCRSVTDQLTKLSSQLSDELSWMKARLEEQRAWIQGLEVSAREVTRAYAFDMMLAQISSREDKFVEAIVARAGAFRVQMTEFLADLVSSTEAFIKQLVPQPDPATLLAQAKGEQLTENDRTVGEEPAGATLKAAPSTEKSAASSKKGSHRRSARKKRKEDSEEPDGRVGNFSKAEIDTFKKTLKKLLGKIDATAKSAMRSMEHKMEVFCGQLDEASKRVYNSITSQMADVKLSESMQLSFTSIQTLVRVEIHLNQEETAKVQRMLEELKGTLDSYEHSWITNLKQESQIHMHFQPNNAVEWEEQDAVLLSDCLVEGLATLDMVTELNDRLTTRLSYIYYESLNGTVDFAISECPRAREVVETDAEDALTTVSGTMEQTSMEEVTVSRGSSGSVMNSSIRSTSAKNKRSPRSKSEKASTKATNDEVSGNINSAAPTDVSAGTSEVETMQVSEYITDVSDAQTAGATTAAADSAVTSGATSRNTSAKRRKNRQSAKKRKKEVKPMLSKMDDSNVRTMLFGGDAEPDESDNFLQKIKRRVVDVLAQAREYGSEYYQAKGGRAVVRPDLIPATYERFLEIMLGRFQEYFKDSSDYQLVCFGEFCQDFTTFACSAARIPGLLFGNQASLYCREVAAMTDEAVRDLSALHETWQRTADGLELLLRPSLGHPNMHSRLFALVEQCVAEKEQHLSALRARDQTYAHDVAATQQLFQQSVQYVEQQCERLLLPLSAAAHLSAAGRQRLRGLLSGAIAEARAACLGDWTTESPTSLETWAAAVASTRDKCRDWENWWFAGVESIQQLHRVCQY